MNGTAGDGITISIGTLTYSITTPAGAGSAIVDIGGTRITAALTGSEGIADAVSAKVAAAINSDNYPITATDDGSGVVTVYPRHGRVMRRLSASIATTTGVAVAVANHGDTGVGAPTLTSALAAAHALNRGFAAWVCPWTDAATLGAVETHLETEGNGVIQKNQTLFIGSASRLATAGAIPTAPSPALTAMTNSGATLLWCKDAPQQAFELAARYAAIYTGTDYAAFNYDGALLKTSGTVPLGVPALADRPGRADREAAMGSYFMTVLVVDGGNRPVIERGMTCSSAANLDIRELSTIRQLHVARPNLNAYLSGLFFPKSLRVTGAPKTANTVTPTSVRDAVIVWAQALDDLDLFDGADSWKSQIQVSQDPTYATRLRIFIPLAIVRSLHQLTTVLSPK